MDMSEIPQMDNPQTPPPAPVSGQVVPPQTPQGGNSNRKTLIILAAIVGGGLCLLCIACVVLGLWVPGNFLKNNVSVNQDQGEMTAIVTDLITDLENEKYDAAYARFTDLGGQTETFSVFKSKWQSQHDTLITGFSSLSDVTSISINIPLEDNGQSMDMSANTVTGTVNYSDGRTNSFVASLMQVDGEWKFMMFEIVSEDGSTTSNQNG